MPPPGVDFVYVLLVFIIVVVGTKWQERNVPGQNLAVKVAICAHVFSLLEFLNTVLRGLYKSTFVLIFWVKLLPSKKETLF